ncbi:MAG: SagB/ThcOx family dehydrogenase, partial [Nannocystis sp.]
MSDDHERVLAYHARSKHRPGRYAASLGYLDWDSQPNPFRVYSGAETLALPRRPLPDGPSYAAVSRGAVAAAPLDLEWLDALLLHSLALSAWKQAGSSRWSLRVNPSSGNLHPTEAYLLAPAIDGLSPAPGLYHYNPLLHALERRASLPAATWQALTHDLPEPGVLVGLSSIAWREAWKYGERGFRYCQHDLGHAVAAIALAAALLGWRARELPAAGDDALATLLGLRHGEGPEAELPETLLVLTPKDMSSGTAASSTWTPPAAMLAEFATTELLGEPNQLSEAHQEWPAIDEVARATRRPPAIVLPAISA